MHYVQVNKNYFQKVYANGNKKRISRNEYLEKTTQKGGNDTIKIIYDGKTYNYQMGATNNIKTKMAPKLKTDFVKKATIKINETEYKLQSGTINLLSRKNNLDKNTYNNYIILEKLGNIIDLPTNEIPQQQQQQQQQGGFPPIIIFLIIVIILICIGNIEFCLIMGALSGGSKNAKLTPITKLKELYYDYIKKTSYFKIGEINSKKDVENSVGNINGDDQYFMKVTFSSKYLQTYVQIDEIVTCNK